MEQYRLKLGLCGLGVHDKDCKDLINIIPKSLWDCIYEKSSCLDDDYWDIAIECVEKMASEWEKNNNNMEWVHGHFEYGHFEKGELQ